MRYNDLNKGCMRWIFLDYTSVFLGNTGCIYGKYKLYFKNFQANKTLQKGKNRQNGLSV